MISFVITTYGDDGWEEMAWARAYPSVVKQEPYEVIVHHSSLPTIGPARNEAAAKATGEFLCFLDGDDELDEGYRQAMINAICHPSRPEPALLQPSVSYIRNGRAAAPFVRPETDLRVDNFLVIGTVLRKELFDQVGGFGDYDHGFEDWALFAKCWKAGAKVFPVPDAVYLAHINLGSKRRVAWRNRQEQVAEHVRIQKELFPEYGGLR